MNYPQGIREMPEVFNLIAEYETETDNEINKILMVHRTDNDKIIFYVDNKIAGISCKRDEFETFIELEDLIFERIAYTEEKLNELKNLVRGLK